MTAAVQPLSPIGTEILLVFGAKIKVSREGRPGIRVTAGYHDGSVLLEAIGYRDGAANVAIGEAGRACEDAGLIVRIPPYRMSNFPARIVRKRPPS